MTSPKKPKGEAVVQTEIAPLSSDDEAARTWVRERVGANPRQAPAYEDDPNDSKSVRRREKDFVLHQNRLCRATGSATISFNSNLVHRLLMGANADGESLTAGLQYVASFEPKNEVEAAILVQAWLSYQAHTELLKRTVRTENPNHLAIQGAAAAKIGGLHIRQLETLAKLRGGGKQEVVVTHVHQHVYVGSGGQAVVGHVTSGGSEIGNLTRPPIPISDAILPAVWSEDAGDREALPVASGSGTAPL